MRVPLSQLLRCFEDEAPLAAIPIEEIARVLNARVSEVEHIHRHPAREKFADVRIVEAVAPGERVFSAAGDVYTRWEMVHLAGTVHIVIGDKFGVKVGDRVAAVLAGGTVPDGTVIQPRAVSGVAIEDHPGSQPQAEQVDAPEPLSLAVGAADASNSKRASLQSDGVLVSELQLGIGKDTARPLVFGPDTSLDADPWQALGGAEVIFEFDLEPNRPDLFSLSGVARDVAAIWGLTLRPASQAQLAELPALDLPIRLETPRARHYAGLQMRGLKVGPSPQWLQNAMRGFGMRPINNVVDAANLVMLELGQPVHTFDHARVGPGAIVLRMATPGETITTLDDVTRTLTDECLLVCHAEPGEAGSRPIAIAGIMGDGSTEVHAGTTDVVIESAAFDMAAVRRASRRLSLRTEASLRFEKGLPICGVMPALTRLGTLLGELCGARAVAFSSEGAPVPERTAIPFDRDVVRQRLGMEVSDADMDRLLQASGLDVGADYVLSPEFRPDLRIPQDLLEEVGRLHGYENVRSEAPTLPLKAPAVSPVVRLARASRRVLTAAGLDEVYLPVWIGDEDVARFQLDPERLIRLINPLASNLTTFRTTALPALLDACIQNRKELPGFGIFEVGRVYRRIPGDPASGAIDERQHLAGISIGRDLLEMRDVLIELGRTLGAGLTISRPSRPDFALSDVLHPGRSLALGTPDGQVWCTLGELHPRLVRAVGLRETPLVFWADLESLLGVRPAPVRFVPPPRHPSVVLDLNVTIGERDESGSVLSALPDLPDLLHAEVADVYRLESGARVTLRFTWNGGERSLTAEEAQASLQKVREALAGSGFAV